jgi:aminopeptidase YwaD
MFVDGDFTIPSVYCTEGVADRLAAAAGERVWLRIDASRTETTANNVVVRRNTDAARKIVFTAHIDAYEDSPGASDNAAGTVVLMLLAELLAAREAPIGLELVALNGEDHYSAGGQMDYLQRYGDELDRVTIVVNADDVGFRGARSAFSFYECSDDVRSAAEALFRGYPGLVAGDPWYMGDHMIFVQQGLPAIAFSTERMEELMSTVAHTAADVPQIVDCERLVELAHALDALVEELGEAPPQRAS